jgi:hypothetical protein
MGKKMSRAYVSSDVEAIPGEWKSREVAAGDH